MFIDSTRLMLRAGDGGNGCVSFRREKYAPRGGPNGGDGGRGGDIVLRVEPSFNTFLHLHHQRLIQAERGQHGQGSNKTGADGGRVVIPVPAGTLVRELKTGAALADLVEAGQEVVIARGGAGGRGNARFATSTNQAPRRADPGRPGQQLEVELELKLLADLGLVGLPNAGKSTLLSRLSAARPKIADYPFTTLEPHLGVVKAPDDEYRTLVVADIPGLIEGAHEGAGLGIRFLRHVERCRGLVHLVDLSDPSSIADRVATIRAEIEAYSADLGGRPWILVGTKLDAVAEPEVASLAAELETIAASEGVRWTMVSAVSGRELKQLLYEMFELAGERA